MERNSMDERLQQIVAEGAAAHRAMRAAETEEKPRPCAVGDLYIFSPSASYAVEWLVVMRDPARLDRVLAIAVDTMHLVGSQDLRIQGQAPGSGMVARLAHGRWLDQRHCHPEQRIGTVASGEIFQLRRRMLELGDSVARSSPVGEEIDEDAEYQDWIREEVEPAWKSLQQLESGGRNDDSQAEPLRPRWPALTGGLQFAAALLLMAVLGWWWSDLFRDNHPAEAVAIISPVVKLAQPRSETRGPLLVEIPQGTTHLLLGLQENEAVGTEGVQVELVSGTGSRVTVEVPHRWPVDGGVLRIPIELLRDESYTLTLAVRRDGVAEVLEEYEFTVRLER